jgi:hypothetical protein
MCTCSLSAAPAQCTSACIDCHASSVIIILGFFGIGSSWQGVMYMGTSEWQWWWLVIHIYLLTSTPQHALTATPAVSLSSSLVLVAACHLHPSAQHWHQQ